MYGKIVSHQQYWIDWPFLSHLFQEFIKLLLVDRIWKRLEMLDTIFPRSSNDNCSRSCIKLFHINQDIHIGQGPSMFEEGLLGDHIFIKVDDSFAQLDGHRYILSQFGGLHDYVFLLNFGGELGLLDDLLADHLLLVEFAQLMNGGM